MYLARTIAVHRRTLKVIAMPYATTKSEGRFSASLLWIRRASGASPDQLRPHPIDGEPGRKEAAAFQREAMPLENNSAMTKASTSGGNASVEMAFKERPRSNWYMEFLPFKE